MESLKESLWPEWAKYKAVDPNSATPDEMDTLKLGLETTHTSTEAAYKKYKKDVLGEFTKIK